MRLVLLCLWAQLCRGNTDDQKCPRPTLARGFLVPEQELYEHGSSIPYSCDPGLKPAAGRWWGVITCEKGEWSHSPQCVDNGDCITPDVPHAKPKPLQLSKGSYSDKSRVEFVCDKGFEFKDGGSHEAVCEGGKWTELPVCSRKHTACDAPVRVSNAVVTEPSRDTYEHTDRVEYQCKQGYELKGQKYSYCMFSVWTPAPTCGRGCDVYPTVKNGVFFELEPRKSIRFECATLYKRLGPERVRCVNGQWSELPVCKAPCKLDLTRLYYRQTSEYMEHGEKNFKCSLFNTVAVHCDDGKAYYRGCDWNEW
ncbi:complement factor H-related protein 1-like isoform X2 [Hoplias malabaricus]|uniref:complement factor H-related protein 1-like isoform X2 n=1 Tax=Hoplias malabaricus TaxID=27720 RepID=UPI003461DAAE